MESITPSLEGRQDINADILITQKDELGIHNRRLGNRKEKEMNTAMTIPESPRATLKRRQL